jgi:hypothetical protein
MIKVKLKKTAIPLLGSLQGMSSAEVLAFGAGFMPNADDYIVVDNLHRTDDELIDLLKDFSDVEKVWKE